MKGLQAGSISALRHVLLSVRTDTGQGEPLSEDAVSKAFWKVGWKATAVGNFHVAGWKAQSRYICCQASKLMKLQADS